MSKLYVGKDILGTSLQDVFSALAADKVVVVADKKVIAHHKEADWVPPHPSIFTEMAVLSIEEPEKAKTVEGLAKVWDFFHDEQLSRRSAVIAIGGGALTDLVGFAASTFKRGIRHINISTTLLGMVDASMGGKTAINFHGVKNAVGSFHQPEAVILETNFLSTLSSEEFLSGYGEVIKTSYLSDETFRQKVLTQDPFSLQKDEEILPEIIEQCVRFKEQLTTADPKENGIRQILNLGHTVGHAIEALSMQSQVRISHGHAVVLGMVAELFVSYRRATFPSSKLMELVTYMKEYYPSLGLNCGGNQQLMELMRQDKKNHNGKIIMPYLSDIGLFALNQEPSHEDLLEGLDFLVDAIG